MDDRVKRGRGIRWLFWVTVALLALAIVGRANATDQFKSQDMTGALTARVDFNVPRGQTKVYLLIRLEGCTAASEFVIGSQSLYYAPYNVPNVSISAATKLTPVTTVATLLLSGSCWASMSFATYGSEWYRFDFTRAANLAGRTLKLYWADDTRRMPLRRSVALRTTKED